MAGVSGEDVFEVPAAWSRHVVPRRGAPGPALTVAPAVDTDLAGELDRTVARLPAVLGHPETPAPIAAAGLEFVARPAAASPLGAAVAVAALPRRTARAPQAAFDSLVDVWVSGAGVRHTARVVAEVAGLYAGSGRTGATDLVTWAAPDSPRQAFLRDIWTRLALRLRAHLAAADADEHAAVVADLAALRDDPRPLRRVTASLLAPTVTTWVDKDCATFADATDETFCRLLLPAAGTRGQLDVLLRVVAPHWLFWDEPTILTLAAAIGPDLEPVLLHLLRTEALSADPVAWTAGILAAFPTDTAFDALAERSGWRPVQPALAAAIRRFPDRAVRRLAEGPAHPTVDVLLAAHVRADPARATRLLPDLGEPAAARVRALLHVDAGPVAAPGAVPAVLATPPWTVR
ncbi:hypothetical protein AB0K00_44705, partial [Dactylosporangium sp. NPDC049525]